MLAYTSAALTHVRLPPGDPSTRLVYIMVQIRDTLNSGTDYPLTPVSVVPDMEELKTLISVLHQNDSFLTNSNPKVRLLASNNLNTVGQILTSISQVFSRMSSESIDKATASELIYSTISLCKHYCVSDGIPATSISISPLGTTRGSLVSSSILKQYLQ